MKFLNIPQQISVGVEKANALLCGTDDILVRFQEADHLSVSKEQDCVVIGYSRKGEALRGMSMAKRVWQTGEAVCQKAKYETLTVMIDCSRNAVLTVDSLKDLMIYLGMIGFNSIMLYTEDTYEIPGHPYFGHMRGRYSVKELQELDSFGQSVGIEMIPCIQTLAHLNCIFKWSTYAKVHDIDDIMLADSEDTYALVEEMLKACRASFSSRYINIGMDEAHHLGRGKFLDNYGYSEKPDIMLRHLDKVVQLCKKYDFEPVMWSDMFFRMQFGGRYNVAEGELSAEVIGKIPEEVALCYWDYYTPPAKEPMLAHMMQQHVRTNRNIWFAGGSWAWTGHTPKNYFSNQVTPLQLSYAQKSGIKNIIATVWGDDGGECPVWNILPSLLQYGELCYDDANDESMEVRSMECFGLSYTDFLKIDQIAKPDVIDVNRTVPPCLEKMALFNDVLQGLLDWDLQKFDLVKKYTRDAKILSEVPASAFDFLFDTQKKLAELLVVKTDLSVRIKQAYRQGDKQALENIVQKDIPEVEQKLEAFAEAMSTQWYTINKPFGFEVQDLRVGGLKERLKAAKMRINQYLDGKVSALEELEQADLPYSELAEAPSDRLNSYGRTVTAGRFTW